MNPIPIHSSDQLVERAIQNARSGHKKIVAVAAAQDAHILEAVSGAAKDGLIEPVLIGDGAKIKELADQNEIPITGFDIIDEKDAVKAARVAAAMASEGEAHIIMKGFLSTTELLKVVLGVEYGLRVKDTLSHCALLDIPGYHKLLNLTDGGVVVKPDRDQKFQILENAVNLGRALGLSPVKVAVSGAYDLPLERMSHAYSDLDFIIPEAMARLDDIAIQGPLPLAAAS